MTLDPSLPEFIYNVPNINATAMFTASLEGNKSVGKLPLFIQSSKLKAHLSEEESEQRRKTISPRNGIKYSIVVVRIVRTSPVQCFI